MMDLETVYNIEQQIETVNHHGEWVMVWDGRDNVPPMEMFEHYKNIHPNAKLRLISFTTEILKESKEASND